MRRLTHMLATLAIAAVCTRPATGRAEDADVARGRYLVELGGCTHCHTPGFLTGKPDPSRYLGGSDLGFEVAGLGTFVGPNLTPDKETGLGAWTRDEVIAAIRTGVRPDGRMLIPIMSWRDFAALTDSDVGAIVDYLRTLPPVVNEVLGPFGPNEKPAITRMRVVPPQDAARLERVE